jgi:hypothetical protein
VSGAVQYLTGAPQLILSPVLNSTDVKYYWWFEKDTYVVDWYYISSDGSISLWACFRTMSDGSFYQTAGDLRTHLETTGQGDMITKWVIGPDGVLSENGRKDFVKNFMYVMAPGSTAYDSNTVALTLRVVPIDVVRVQVPPRQQTTSLSA